MVVAELDVEVFVDRTLLLAAAKTNNQLDYINNEIGFVKMMLKTLIKTNFNFT